MIPKDEQQEILIGIQTLASHCARISKEHGWWEDESRNMGEVHMLFVTEIAEAFEEFRRGLSLNEVYYLEGNVHYTIEDIVDPPFHSKPEGPMVEFADVIIRMLDLIGHQGLGNKFAAALLWKIRFNETRPYRHGGKKA